MVEIQAEWLASNTGRAAALMNHGLFFSLFHEVSWFGLVGPVKTKGDYSWSRDLCLVDRRISSFLHPKILPVGFFFGSPACSSDVPLASMTKGPFFLLPIVLVPGLGQLYKNIMYGIHTAFAEPLDGE